MKSMVRNLRSLTLMIVIIVATGVTTSSAPAPQNAPDPACVSTCVGLLYQCILNRDKKNDQACMSVYHHCLAHCGKD
jgi:hypothetical protein